MRPTQTKGSSPWRPSESVAVDVDPSASLLGTRDSPDWFNDEQTQQTTIMHHQDQQLEAVHGTVRNIRTMAHTMGTELEDHNVMLEEIDTQVDHTQSKLSRAMKNVERMIKDNSKAKLANSAFGYPSAFLYASWAWLTLVGNRSFYIILILIVVVLVLLALVIVT